MAPYHSPFTTRTVSPWPIEPGALVGSYCFQAPPASVDFGRLVPDGVVVRGTNDRPIEGQYTTHVSCVDLGIQECIDG